MKIAILSRNRRLYSTRRLVEAAAARGHKADVIDYLKCYFVIEKGSPAIHYHGKKLCDIDAVIPRIGASNTFYGTAVVRQFEMMKVFCANGSQGILRSRDKLSSAQLLATEEIGIPVTAFASSPSDITDLIREVGGAPLVIKMLQGTQGIGVVLAETNKAAASVMEAFYGVDANMLIQEYIKEAGGADTRVFVVGGEVVGAMKRQGPKGEFRSNIHRGGSASRVVLTKQEAKTALKAAKVLGLNVAGVDMIQSTRGSLIMEVNSSPGLEGIEGATGIDIAGKIIGFIEKKRRSAVKDKALRSA